MKHWLTLLCNFFMNSTSRGLSLKKKVCNKKTLTWS